MKNFPNGAVNFILAAATVASVAPSLAAVPTFAQTPVADLPALALPRSNETASDATLVGDVLKLDDTNEADQTDGKIAAWVETLKAAL